MQTTGLHRTLYDLIQPRLIDRDLPSNQRLDLLLIDIHTSHIDTNFRKTRPGDKTDITGSNNGYIHT